MRIQLQSLFVVVVIVAASLAPAAAVGETHLNVLLIMADDPGAENLARYGNTVHATPNLDRMAREGAQFDHAYATPVCTPNRAMILTGVHPNRTGFLERLDIPDDSKKSTFFPNNT